MILKMTKSDLRDLSGSDEGESYFVLDWDLISIWARVTSDPEESNFQSE